MLIDFSPSSNEQPSKKQEKLPAKHNTRTFEEYEIIILGNKRFL